MTTLEREILQRIRQLAADRQQRVLDFVVQLENERPLSAVEIMRLPKEQRERIVAAAITASAHVEFETFEAYSEELLDE